MLGRRHRSPSSSPPPNHRRRLNLRRSEDNHGFEDLHTGEDEGGDQCPEEDEREVEHNGDVHGVEEEPRGESNDAENSSDHAEKGGKGGRARQQKKKKCTTHGAAAPAAWIVDPRRRVEEGTIMDRDLREEEFIPSRPLEEDEYQAIGHISQSTLSQPGLLTLPPEPENQVLHYPGYHFVLDLVLACRSFLSNQDDTLMQIFEFLRSTNTYSTDSRRTTEAVMAFDSLENLAARCGRAEENIAVTHFVFMVNAIQLRCKVIRFVSPSLLWCYLNPYCPSTCDTTKKKKTGVLKTIKSQKTVRTLAAYVSDGAKFCLLAGGGLFF